MTLTRKRRLSFFIFLAVLAGGAVAFAAEGGAAAHDAEPNMTHRMMMLMLQLGTILFAARLGNLLFEKLRLPGVLGELAAGILIGPFMLGALSVPGFPHGLFPEIGTFPVSPELYGICSVAAIILLFMVGLETDIKLFMRYSLAGSLVGIGGVAVSFILGDLMAVLFSQMLFGEARGFFAPSSLFLGIISTATSVGITARVLSEQRRLDSPEGVTILAGAVIDDVLGIVLLAVGLGVISASKASGSVDWGHIGIIAGKAVGIWLAATTIGLLAARRISVLLKWFRERSSIAVMALGLALILAGLFEEAGLAMIVGAYVMGLSLSRTDISHVIRERLEPIYGFMVPIFFTVMGMMVNVRLLASRNVLLFGAVYTLGAVVAKIIGCGVPALFCNFNVRGATRIGFGMLPRGEVALIISGIGLAAGLLTQEVFGVGVMMTLVTTLIAPPFLVALFKSKRSGLRRQVTRQEGAKLVFAFPSEEAVALLVGKLQEVFASEGFFVHALSHDEQLYQLRKDAIVITFHTEGREIIFDCAPRETPFVNTAMMEVVAELEQTVRALREPVDAGEIGRKVQQDISGARPHTSLARYLSLETLVPELKGGTKKDVIDEMLNLLDRHKRLSNVTAAHEAVWNRERSMSTGMQYGIAIPHGRTDAVSSLTCVIGLHREGIDFESIDGQPSHIVVLTLSPASAAAPHVQFMSSISQALDEEGRRALLESRSAKEMYDVLVGQRRAQPAAPAAVTALPAAERKAQPMTRYLRRDLLTVNLRGRTREAVIGELIELVAARTGLADPRAAREAVLAREAQMPTAMEHGLAIPHARTDAVQELTCAIGISREGVDFSAIDGEPAKIVILSLSPLHAPAPHVQLLAMLSRALDAKGRERALAARNTDELWNILTGA